MESSKTHTKDPHNNSIDENSMDDDDDLSLKIAESPKPKRRSKPHLDDIDREIIACVEKTIEDTLEEKAAKTNLTTHNVKKMLRDVVTNEDVLALIRHAENPEECDKPITVYEPKCTRAKAKELQTLNVLPRPPLQTPSDVHVLLQQELEADSSGDEYLPSGSLSAKSVKKKGVANIALRTRSKLCLSDTPLEKIEEAFIPPDITTDMYNMDCDDDVWADFLKTFTKPLDEVTKQAEDEDHDPEYNILADEEMDKVDKEELRADKAVTVSRKEFNALMAELNELSEYTHVNESNQRRERMNHQMIELDNNENHDKPIIAIQQVDTILSSQLCLLAQQMRQHVQMLTQNFFLTYEHPEFADMAVKCKDSLISFREASKGRKNSIFNTLNLMDALKLIEDWEQLLLSNSLEAFETKSHMHRVIYQWNQAKLANTEYIPTFPPLVLETISKSRVFLYPHLLPRVPFRSNSVYYAKQFYYFTHSENNLIALFMEQLIPTMKQDPYHLTRSNNVNLAHVAFFINKYLMPWVSINKIHTHIRNKKKVSSEDNPIKYYFKYHRAPNTTHFATHLDPKDMKAPCEVAATSLPYQWRTFLHPNFVEVSKKDHIDVVQTIFATPVNPPTPAKVIKPPVYNVSFAGRPRRRILPKQPLIETSNAINFSRKRRIVNLRKRDSVKIKSPPISKQEISVLITMMPDMPSLGSTANTPVKNPPSATITSSQAIDNPANNRSQELSFQNILQRCLEIGSPEISGVVRNNLESSTETIQKDNPQDIDEFMKASSTVKVVTKKEPSGAEKKRAKMRREFLANLNMATPDDIETAGKRHDDLAEGYFAKLKMQLDDEDYAKIIKILKKHDEQSDKFTDLYNKIQGVLEGKYPELSDEFLLFLTDTQAHKVGKLMQYFIVKDMNKFLQKLQVYYKDQPNQLKKIWKCLTDLAENPLADMEMVKTTMFPFFKGNSTLIEWFLQMFPGESPMKVINNGPSEKVDLSKEQIRSPDEDIYETIAVPDTEDPYGGPGCICKCHTIENPQLQSITLHCNHCGIKFIQGKVYVQTGKGLRPANVSFLTSPDKNHTIRLNAPSPNKQSPNKDGTMVDGQSIYAVERNPDGTKKRIKRRKKKDPSVEKPPKSGAEAQAKKTIKKAGSKSERVVRKRTTSTSRKTVRKSKRPAEDVVDDTELPEIAEPQVNSAQSAESESEIFETSQDITTTDSEDSAQPALSSAGGSDIWTRTEDKIILQSFQLKRGSDDETFHKISEILKTRSVTDVKHRFQKLMALLQQMESE